MYTFKNKNLRNTLKIFQHDKNDNDTESAAR